MAERVIQVGTRAVIFNKSNELLVAHNLPPETDCYYLLGARI
jgi:hypothetical protein